ncbi:hypothetical protein DM02DRAFT_365224 [Periconia macrospinosa]|uniref:Uncharacterized protein n=1 Tax=Periconia macrospinosa TaxID=97972 RepID=A0A2V1DSV4_9PLEO|nr:hypothetical protein DM02DRAFT_365224 [Periconia macrospinosa]
MSRSGRQTQPGLGAGKPSQAAYILTGRSAATRDSSTLAIHPPFAHPMVPFIQCRGTTTRGVRCRNRAKFPRSSRPVWCHCHGRPEAAGIDSEDETGGNSGRRARRARKKSQRDSFFDDIEPDIDSIVEALHAMERRNRALLQAIKHLTFEVCGLLGEEDGARLVEHMKGLRME